MRMKVSSKNIQEKAEEEEKEQRCLVNTFEKKGIYSLGDSPFT